VQIVGDMEVHDYGKFAWILDPDGRKVELWEANDEVFETILQTVNPQM
jgi:hypothetical protein